ncbi:MAG: cytochrome P450 [Actinomycetota bacterium]
MSRSADRPSLAVEADPDEGERAVPSRDADERGYRSYEIYQRRRITESSPDILPRHLWSDRYLDDPYGLVGALREHGPCYRDWAGNAFWVTRYDDVTSVLVDDANFETRTWRWSFDLHRRGRDLGRHVPVMQAEADVWDADAADVAERLVARALGAEGEVALGVADRLAAELECRVLGLDPDDWPWFVSTVGRLRNAGMADPAGRASALSAFDELAARFDRLVDERRGDDGADLISVAARLELDRPVGGDDIAATVVEADPQTLPGSMANLWFLLATHPGHAERIVDDRRLVVAGWLEAVRHSPPVVAAERWARHEVERFGQLLPEGARVICSVAAANRDPRIFGDPDTFDPFRLDLCQREPRGHHRADGLAAGVVPALGPPSLFPAVPEDRPRSRYARVRDVAVVATGALLDRVGVPALADPEAARPSASRLGGPHRSWELVVERT